MFLLSCNAFFFLLSFGIAVITTPTLIYVALTSKVTAEPNGEVITHQQTIPLLGGIGILAGFLPALVYVVYLDPQWLGLALGLALLSPLGLFKDFHQEPFPPAIQLCIQTAVLITLAWFGFRLDFDLSLPFNYLLTVLVGLWLLNGINFIDVVDGLAGGVTGIAALFMGIFFILVGDDGVFLAFALAGGCLGFLVYNRSPAKIFMGDIGSFSIGLILLACLLASPPDESQFLQTIPILIVPCADVAITSIVRLVKKKTPTQGGPEHPSLIMLNRGIPPLLILISYYTLGIVGGVTSLISLFA